MVASDATVRKFWIRFGFRFFFKPKQQYRKKIILFGEKKRKPVFHKTVFILPNKIQNLK